MQNMYRKAAEFWAELRLELLSASEFFAEEKGNSNQIWRLYWASHQVLLPCVFNTSFYAIYCLCKVSKHYMPPILAELKLGNNCNNGELSLVELPNMLKYSLFVMLHN